MFKTFLFPSIAICIGIPSPVSSVAKDVTLGKAVEKHTKIESLSHRGKYRFKKVSSPTRRGKVAQRFEIRHGDCGRVSGWDDCNSDRGRVERKENPKNKMSKTKGGVWYGYSMLIPNNFRVMPRARGHSGFP